MLTDATHAPIQPLDPATLARNGYLAGYSGSTAVGYGFELDRWFAWCAAQGVPVLEVKRVHIEIFGRELEGRYARSTTAHNIGTITGWYRYCESEDLVAKSPARFVRRPKVSSESNTLGLDRIELGAFIAQAGAMTPLHHAMTCLLALNGLRVAEVCASNVEDLATERGHRVLRIIGKGHKPAIVPLSPRTARSLDMAIAERIEGPILLKDGVRLDRWAALRMTKAIARKAGITKKISPHSLRHSFITAALDAGVPLRDVQIAARHADPRTTTRYDRHRANLDRHATYVVTAFVAGAA